MGELVTIDEEGMLDKSCVLTLKHLVKTETPPIVKEEGAEDLEKYNQCHGYRGRFCSSGGGGGGGAGGSGTAEGDLPPWMTPKPDAKPPNIRSPGTIAPINPPGIGDVIGGVRDAEGARTALKPLIGKEVTFEFTAHHQGGPSHSGVGYSHFLKDMKVTPKDSKTAVDVDHLWLQNAPPVIRNAKEGDRRGGGMRMKATGTVGTYVKKLGRDYEIVDVKNIQVLREMPRTYRKGMDVDDIHVASPSWRGKKRSEMTKEELAACEKARATCPKIKKSVELFKLDDDQRLIYGVVLVPDVEDLQGDICSKEDIQEAAHDYLVNSRLIKAQHRAPTDAEVVQSYIAPIDIPIGKGIAPAGSWVMVTKINSSAMWTAIKKGDITGYSIGGRGTREEI